MVPADWTPVPGGGADLSAAATAGAGAPEAHAGRGNSSKLGLKLYPFMLHPASLHKLHWDYFIIAVVLYNVFYLPFDMAFGACEVRRRRRRRPLPFQLLSQRCELADAVQSRSRSTTRANGHKRRAAWPINLTDVSIQHFIRSLQYDARVRAQERTCAESPVLSALGYIADAVFWTDLVVSFRTGYVDNKQIVHMNPFFVARHYLRTWFAVDLVSCLPLDNLATGAPPHGPPLQSLQHSAAAIHSIAAGGEEGFRHRCALSECLDTVLRR